MADNGKEQDTNESEQLLENAVKQAEIARESAWRFTVAPMMDWRYCSE